jgi:hypothetical protein
MSANNKIERKVVIGFAKLIKSDQLIKRTRLLGWLFNTLAFLFLWASLFLYLQQSVVSHNVLFFPFAGGVCMVLGWRYSQFSTQWYFIKQFIAQDAVERRINELSA